VRYHLKEWRQCGLESVQVRIDILFAHLMPL
jgi:hypothetical protein